MAHMVGWQLRLSSWALTSIGRAMGAKPRDAGSSPVESTFFPSNIISLRVSSISIEFLLFASLKELVYSCDAIMLQTFSVYGLIRLAEYESVISSY